MLQAYEAVFSMLLSFALVASAAYVGVLKALDVYYSEEKDSVLLSNSDSR